MPVLEKQGLFDSHIGINAQKYLIAVYIISQTTIYKKRCCQYWLKKPTKQKRRNKKPAAV